MLSEIAKTEPVWDIAKLFPSQGHWSIDDYLALEAGNNHLIEFSHGFVEVLSMPSIRHQQIVRRLFNMLFSFVELHSLGEVFFAPTRVELWENKIREPDLFFVSHAHLDQRTEQWFEQIDLAIEVVSPDDPGRDLETKRREYAQADIPEYWVVDPRSHEILVLTLAEKQYAIHGIFNIGQTATSVLISNFSVPVAEIFS